MRLSLDDFGTGYSSLTYLSSLPIQQVKIDQSFVADILTSGRDAAIVTSMIDLAHHLGLQIIAEGIEDHGVRERLRRLGCDFGQGFLYAQSMDPDRLPAWELENSSQSRHTDPPPRRWAASSELVGSEETRPWPWPGGSRVAA